MEFALHTTARSGLLLWTTRALRALVLLFLLVDVVGHIVMPPPVVQAFDRLGLSTQTGPGLGLLCLVLMALYLTPRTSVIGSILLTGYLGGASAIDLRAGSSPFETVFPVLFGVLVWAPLYLTDERAKGAFR